MNDIIMDEMVNKQLNNINHKYYLTYFDKFRIRKKIRKSLFDDKCTFFHAYITKEKKHGYCSVHIFYNKKKVMLKGLLYINYINPNLNNNQKITNTCENPLICINVNHLKIIEPK